MSDYQIVGRALTYPVLEVVLSDPRTGRAWLLGPCCFQDLLGKDHDDFELSGMGLAIIGNICQGIKNGVIDMAWDAVIQVRHGEGADPVPLPWPGQPDDRPLKLNLATMPFDPIMFLEGDKFKYRIDRINLMDRIQATWIPYLKAKLAFGRVAA